MFSYPECSRTIGQGNLEWPNLQSAGTFLAATSAWKTTLAVSMRVTAFVRNVFWVGPCKYHPIMILFACPNDTESYACGRVSSW